MKNVWIDIDNKHVVLFDSHDGQPILGWAGDVEWGLKEAYAYAARRDFNVTHETRPLPTEE